MLYCHTFYWAAVTLFSLATYSWAFPFVIQSLPPICEIFEVLLMLFHLPIFIDPDVLFYQLFTIVKLSM